MKQFPTLMILCLILIACNATNKENEAHINKKKDSKPIISQTFFKYDNIDYYFNDFDESAIGDLIDNQHDSEIDSFKMGIIIGEIPIDISDLTFISNLKAIGYNKHELNKSKFKNIDSIFREKSSNEDAISRCIHIYRDLLIFKKLNKVTGTAKVCFTCKAHQINGTKANTSNFGRNGDYDRLQKLLRN